MEQRFYLITGVMASGKSTTAQALAQALPRCVHLRGDLFRRMIVTGREEMAGFSVVLQDNYYGPALEEMASLLRGIPLRLVVLCPSVETVRAREASRGKRGYVGFSPEALWHSFMRETPRAGLWLDNSHMTVEQAVKEILSRGEKSGPCV